MVIIAAHYTDADLAYLREHFRTLEQICAGRAETPGEVRRLISERKLPRPSYLLEDGTELVPTDYFALVDAAGGVDGLRDEYVRRYHQALAENGLDFDMELLERRWESYLDGVSGICMRRVTPETIVRKRVLIDAIEELLSEPRPDEEPWRANLRERVDELDRIEKPFAPDYDRDGRFVPTRDTHIRDVRRRYPHIWV
jgi:hypothetical protein